nr:putative vacuolating cytotoxin [uncultured bacterium]
MADKPRTKGINRKRNSYGLKHVAEGDIGYITNGQFIAAAIHSGFEYEQVNTGANMHFNSSEKWFKRERVRQSDLLDSG